MSELEELIKKTEKKRDKQNEILERHIKDIYKKNDVVRIWKEMSGKERRKFLIDRLKKMYGNNYEEIIIKRSIWIIRTEYFLLFGF